jgi:branched-chain amino acid transport system ATP-binding protein
MKTVLETRKVTKRFGGLTAVNAVDLVVPERYIASVIGPNGAGKTTLFNCISGFYPPDQGQILLAGAPLVGLSPDRIAELGIGRTYQNIRLFKNMTAIENILVGEHPRLKSMWYESILGTPRVGREEAAALSEALRLLRQRPPAVLITDLKMPGMDGIELLEAMQAEAADVEGKLASPPQRPTA